MIYELPENPTCPDCGGGLNVASAEYGEKRAPKPGDLSVCNHCQTFLKYVVVLRLDRLPENEFEGLPELLQRHLLQLRGTQRAFRDQSGPNLN